MADIIRDVVVRLSIQQLESKIKVPEYDKLTKSTEALDKSVIALEESNKSLIATVEELEKKLKGAMNKGKKEVEDYGKKLEEANLRAVEAFRAAGEGAFTLARGIAFVGTSAEEGFNKALLTIAKVQNALDNFEGGTEVVNKVNEAATTMDKAIEAARAGVEILEAVNQAATLSTHILGGGMANLLTVGRMVVAFFMTPMGLAVLAVTAAVAVGVTMWNKYKEAQRKASQEALDRILKETEAVGALINKKRGLIALQRISIGYWAKMDENRIALEEDPHKRLAHAEIALQKARRRRDVGTQGESHQQTLEKIKLAADREVLKARMDHRSNTIILAAQEGHSKYRGMEAIEKHNQQVFLSRFRQGGYTGHEFKEQLAESLKTGDEAFDAKTKERETVLNQNILDIRSKAIEKAETLRDLENGVKRALSNQHDQLRGVLRWHKDILATKKQQLEVTKKDIATQKSTIIGIGRRSPEERAEAEELARRIEAGEDIGQAGRDRFREIVGNTLADKAFNETEYGIGSAATKGTALGRVTGTSKAHLDKLEADRTTLETAVTDAGKKAATIQEQINGVVSETFGKMNQNSENLVEMFRDQLDVTNWVETQVAVLKKEQQELKDEIARKNSQQ